MSKIGIILIATNGYFALGIRFIKRFMHFYKGEDKITFYFYSDENPNDYLPDGIDVVHINERHNNWVDGTNSKFKNIINLENTDCDYLYYFDADTNISQEFDTSWFLGEMVGGEHYGNRTFLSGGVNYDKNPRSKAYVPPSSTLPKTYYYGAFFGGEKSKMINFCKVLRNNQLEDKKINYEPGVNDESYINQYFHFNPPDKTVTIEEFKFAISDKGGLGILRNPKLNISEIKSQLKEYKNDLIDIKSGTICKQ